MEKEELRKKIARIHTAILTHTPVGRDENDFPVAATQTYLYDFISQELDKAKEEGRREVLSKIKEIFETNIPHGLYSPSESSYLYERFGGAIQQYYMHELSKLKQE